MITQSMTTTTTTTTPPFSVGNKKKTKQTKKKRRSGKRKQLGREKPGKFYFRRRAPGVDAPRRPFTEFYRFFFCFFSGAASLFAFASIFKRRAQEMRKKTGENNEKKPASDFWC